MRLLSPLLLLLLSSTAQGQFLLAPASGPAGDCVEFVDRFHVQSAGAPCGSGGGGGAPTDAQYFVAAANGTLSAEVVPSANVLTFLGSADNAAMRTNLGLSALATTVPGTGIAAALTVNVGLAGAPVLFNGALGTPSSGVLTNASGLPVDTGISGFATGMSTFLGVASSANLRGTLTDESGTGSAYFQGGNLGTPSAGVLTNATGLPITSLSGAGTGVLAALGVNVGSAGAPVLFNGAGGTPSSLNLANATALPVSSLSGAGTGVLTWLATPSTANFLAAIPDEGAASTFLRADGTWAVPPGAGDFAGPASSTDNAVVRFDGVTGKIGQNSGVIISDTNDVSGVASLTTTGPLEIAHATQNSFTCASGHCTIESATVWDSANDGAASTLDADLLDGSSSAAFQASDADLTSWAGVARAAGFDAFVAAPSTANFLSTLSDEGAASTFLRADGTWATPSGAGDFAGPASSTDNALVRFDGTTGKVGQNSGVIVSDTNDVSGVATLTTTGALEIGHATQNSLSCATGHCTIETATLWDSVNDGAGSTLDADLLDGSSSAAFQPVDADLTSWAGVTRASGFDTFAATPSSANLASLVTNETGTGALVLGTAPELSAIELSHPTLNTLAASGGHMSIESATVWDAGNDGSGSTLDADLLDGSSSAAFQAADADLTTYAGITPSANVQTMLGSANNAAILSNIGAQASDADLTTYAGITPSANVQTMLGSADNATIRSNIGLAIGTNVQAFDADLTTWAGVTPGTGVTTSLGLAAAEAYDATGWNGDDGIATKNDVRDKIEVLQPLDADLTALAALTTTAAGLSVNTLADPGADQLLFFDDSAGAIVGISSLAGATSSISGTTLTINGANEAYDATGWDGDASPPEKDDVRDQLESYFGSGTWTPTITFSTPGNLNVVYTTQYGDYVRIGEMVFMTFNILTSTFTHTTSSGTFLIQSLPCNSANINANSFWFGSMDWRGITKTNFTEMTPRMANNGSSVAIVASGSGQISTPIQSGDVPTGGTVNLRGQVNFKRASGC